MAISIKDNKEPLVDIKKYCPGIVVALDPKRLKIEKTAYLRRTNTRMLRRAQSYLPRGMNFIIGDAWRPAFVQASIYYWFIKMGRRRYPKLSSKKILQFVDQYVAPWFGNNASGHMSGGALDIRLVDGHGHKIPMKSSRLTYQENALSAQSKLPRYIGRNRKILFDALIKSGFSNYPKEYWHWSYGDYQWAKRNKKKTVLYGTISDWKGLYENKHCPCGSRLKFKRCHGK